MQRPRAKTTMIKPPDGATAQPPDTSAAPLLGQLWGAMSLAQGRNDDE